MKMLSLKRRRLLTPLSGLLIVLSILATPGVHAQSVVATIPMGTQPIAMAVDVQSYEIYVTEPRSNSVAAIAGKTNTIIETIPVARPFAVDVNPKTNQVFVLNGSSLPNTVTLIRERDHKVGAVIPIPCCGIDLAVNLVTNKIYVSIFGANVVAVIDGQTDTVTATIPVPANPFAVAVNPATNRIYVDEQGPAGTDKVTVIDGSTNMVIASVLTGNQPSEFALGVNPATNRIYETDEGGSRGVSVIDGATNTLITTIPVGSAPVGVGSDPLTNRIYVANQGSNTVSVIDGATNTVVANVGVGVFPFGLTVDPKTDRIYVANQGADSVSVIAG